MGDYQVLFSGEVSRGAEQESEPGSFPPQFSIPVGVSLRSAHLPASSTGLRTSHSSEFSVGTNRAR